MRILALHSDYIRFEPKKKAIDDAEEFKGKCEVKECLVVFSAVEKRDEKNPDAVAKNLVKEVADIAKKVKTKKIVLYPYVHLTTEPCSAKTALEILKKAEDGLKKRFNVTRAPFGWYKAFTVSCKGHPLAELSRSFSAEEEAVKAEKKLKSRWFILTKDRLKEISMKKDRMVGFNFSQHNNLESFARYEISKVRAVKQEPPHVHLMKKLEIADYEPGSDPGHLRFYPKGSLIKSLIERYVCAKMNEYGAMEIEAPVMYDYGHDALKNYLDRFPARQYTIQTPNKKVFLRFSSCFGQFLMAHDMSLSYRSMPLKIYELTKSYRVEQHGELTGLRRLRAFTMPDCHAICVDIEDARQEMMKRFMLATQMQKDIGVDFSNLELGIRVTRDFWDKNKKFVIDMVKKWGKPALVEMWDKRFFYFIMKYEFNFIDALQKASALTTDQIDVENAERYDIMYTDKDGKNKYPVILHLSPTGAIERIIYALLEQAYIDEKKGKTPNLPLWLAPTQVRVIPVSDRFNKIAKDIADEIEKENIRVDVDERKLHVGKKIREAETEWVPYVVVLGEREAKTKKLALRVRGKKQIKIVTTKKLVEEIKERLEDMPFKPLALDKSLSIRPGFY